MMNKNIEILAPAGSLEGMRAAMNAGCDAVYIGGSSFGARAYANNLDEETLLRAIDEAHIRNKRLYLTVNTLLKEQELTEKLFGFLEKFYLQGLDAVIVQDMGVLHFIHCNFPELPIHASTQTTLTMAEGANLLKQYGVSRIVTARELALSEIRTIRENTDFEIETFVHGALCYCYSGQCLMSSMIGGRSGNRGRCAQPCRMPYQFYVDGKQQSNTQEKFLLSPKDINTLTILPELAEAGIDSFKIEGRMKRPEYAAAVSFLYRKYLDLYYELGKETYYRFAESKEFEQDMLTLQDVYNRGGFSEGYGKTYHGKSMMSLYRPNHSGTFVGNVCSVKGIRATIELKESVNAQDILEIRQSRNSEEGYEFTVKDSHIRGEFFETNTFKSAAIQEGDQVFRTKNNQLINQLTKEYIEKDKKMGIQGYLHAKCDEPLMLSVTFGECTVTAYGALVQEAVKQPMTKEKLAAPIEKTGDTLYYFDELRIDCGDHVFVPVAWLNEIRREAIALLQEAVTVQFRRAKTDSLSRADVNILTETNRKEPGICISVQRLDQFEEAVRYPEVDAIYTDYQMIGQKSMLLIAEAAGKAEKAFYVILPQICRRYEYNRLKKELIEIIENKAVAGFVVKNFEEVALLQSLLKERKQNKQIILNDNMYTSNREAKVFWTELGITHYTASVEQNYRELKLLDISDSDLIVYGYQPVMVSAQCVFENTIGCKKCRENNKGYLTDRLGKKFFVQTDCSSCSNTIYNGKALSLLKQNEEIKELSPRRIRMDFTKETKEEMRLIIPAFIAAFRYGTNDQQELGDYTTGHFKRGVE